MVEKLPSQTSESPLSTAACVAAPYAAASSGGMEMVATLLAEGKKVERTAERLGASEVSPTSLTGENARVSA